MRAFPTVTVARRVALGSRERGVFLLFLVDSRLSRGRRLIGILRTRRTRSPRAVYTHLESGLLSSLGDKKLREGKVTRGRFRAGSGPCMHAYAIYVGRPL